MRGSRWLILIILLVAGLDAQTRRDPRGIALGGAYGVMARGIFAVDYNPANLAIPHEYDFYRVWGGLNTCFTTNFLSLKTYQKYNGQNLDANGGSLKRSFIRGIPDDGWRIFSDLHLPLPYLNHSRGNRAISADLIVIGDLNLPQGLVRFIFDGNPIGEKLDLDFQEEVLVLGQYGYSLGFPIGDIYGGVTAKYLQGIAYIGLNPDSSYGSITTYFEPGRNYMSGGGQYLFQQSLGGRGFALDLGIVSKEINGYRLGLSVTNLFGRINWQKSTLLSRMINPESVLPWKGKFYKMEFGVNEARFDRFFKKVKYSDVFPGKGKAFRDSSEFSIKYPSLVRFSLARQLEEGMTLSSDLVAGFEERLFSFGSWKWCVGFESTKSKRLPIRVGLAIGGRKQKVLNFGSGFHWGFVHLDWALGFTHGILPTTAKGLDFSCMAYTTSKSK